MRLYFRCADSVLKMSTRFSDNSWRNHKRTLKHQSALGRPLQPQGETWIHVASPSPPHGYHIPAGISSSSAGDFSAALLQGAQGDQEFLSLCYKGLAKQKSERTKFEVDVHEVVNAMTNLITEQQDELDAIQRAMEANSRAMVSLVEDVRVLKAQSQRGRAQASHGSPSSLHRKCHDDSTARHSRTSRSPLFSNSTRGSKKHQERSQSPRKSRIDRGSALRRSTRSPFARLGTKRSVSPHLCSPTRRSSALQRSHKIHSGLRSHEKSESDLFEWTEHGGEDDEDDSTRRMLHMSQYA